MFNVVYAQEVLYTITDLHSHARLIYDILESNGVYFATIGCHTDNPFFNEWRREIIREEESYPVNEYSLDYITEIFSSVGFEVGLKRLSDEYFCIYHPRVIKEFGSMMNLVKHCDEYKMLFCFYKATHNDKN